MVTSKKKYCCIATYRLSDDSILRRLHIKDAVLDEEGLIKLFETSSYKLLAKNDTNGEIDALIYKYDQEEIRCQDINFEQFKKRALEVIEKSLKCLQIAFLFLRNQPTYIVKKRDEIRISTDVLDYESNVKFSLREFIAELITSGSVLNNQFYNVSSQEVVTVLTSIKDNEKINEYIARFVSIENLNSDPVLHLITLFALYEYIKESKPSCKRLERALIKNKKVGYTANLEEKFRNTRHLVAHGFAGGNDSKQKVNTTKILEEFLGVSTSGSYSFERYNPSHINLINEVIGEVQPVIQKYLREELGLKE